MEMQSPEYLALPHIEADSPAQTRRIVIVEPSRGQPRLRAAFNRLGRHIMDGDVFP